MPFSPKPSISNRRDAKIGREIRDRPSLRKEPNGNDNEVEMGEGGEENAHQMSPTVCVWRLTCAAGKLKVLRRLPADSYRTQVERL